LHEFGHQLGLGHNDRENCLMTAKAESNGEAQWNPRLVLTDFFDYEKGLIELEKRDN